MARTSDINLDERIARISARLAQTDNRARRIAERSEPGLAAEDADAPVEERLDLARKVLAARLSREIRRERWRMISRGDLAKVVDAAVNGYFVRHHVRSSPLQRRDLVTDIIQTLIIPVGPQKRQTSQEVPSALPKMVTLDALAASGAMSPAMATLLKIAIRCRLNILVSGEAGSGKTTLLDALCREIGDAESAVVIEDLAELRLESPRVVRMEIGAANRLDAVGAVTMRDLLREALLMRPDRLVVSECRSEEVLDLLEAMSHGRDGLMTTIAASSAADALQRLEEMAGRNLAPLLRRTLIATIFHLVCHTERLNDGTRRLTRITEIHGMADETVSIQDMFAFEKPGDGPGRRLRAGFHASGASPAFLQRAEEHGLGRTLLEACGVS